MQVKPLQKNCAFYNDPTIDLVDQDSWVSNFSLKELIKEKVEQIVNDLPLDSKASKDIRPEIIINKPKNPANGDFSTNVAIIFAKVMDLAPIDLANQILSRCNEDLYLQKICSKIEAVGLGFINFFLKQETYLLELKKVINLKENYGQNKILEGKRILFEYAHPNPFKAFHIGHLRNIIIGESLIRLLENCGSEVIRVNYQGDVGMHIAKCIWAFGQINESDYPTNTDERVKLIANCYAKGAESFTDTMLQDEIKKINKLIYTKEDQKINKLWDLGKKWSLDKFEQIYARLDSTFKRQYMESEVLDLCYRFIDEAKEKKILKESEGAVIFDGEPYGLDTRVFQNSEGLPTYEGKELGLAYLEFTDWGNIDLCIHNVAVEQISFFKVTFKVESLLDPALYKGKQYHNAYEFVGLKSGKMSSRSGKVVLAMDILDQANSRIKDIVAERKGSSIDNIDEISEIVGTGAIKYSFLNISPKSYLAFDMEKSISFDGDSGPYLQYTYARAKKIVSKATEDNLIIDKDNITSIASINELEFDILRKLEQLEETLIEATKNLAPNLLCNYLFTLAQKYNSFYKEIPILTEEKIHLKMFRIELSEAVSIVLKKGLHLLGIKTLITM